MSKEQFATLDGAVRLLIEVHNELVVDHEQTQEERTKGYDLMRRIDAFIDATSAPSERGTLCGSRVCKTECAHPEDCMQQSEPTPATDAVSAAMYEHFKTRAMTVNDIEGFLAHARQLERKARVMQRVLERIPSATRRTTASDVLQVIVDYHRITSGEFNAKYPDKKSWDSEDLIDWAEKEIA